jgi:acetamidase/formamidase
LAPIAGPIVVRGAKPGDVVAIDLIELTPFGSGKSAILRDFGVLRREFPEPIALSSPVRDGRAWFGERIPLPLNPNLGTISTMPPEGYKPSYAGAYGGDFDQKDAGQGSRVYLPVLVEDAARRAVDFTVTRTDLAREEAYMLLSIIGELRVGTSPRPVMATRLIVPQEQLRGAGWNGELP